MADDDDDAKDQTEDQAEDSSSQDGDDAKDQAEDQGEDSSSEEEDDPDFGKKEDEPVNDVQMKYLEPLAEEQGEEIPDDMSEADAANKIDEMQENAAG